MPRGRETSIETGRVSSREMDNVRGDAMSGTGVNPFGGILNKRGYGRDGMQKNSKMGAKKVTGNR